MGRAIERVPGTGALLPLVGRSEELQRLTTALIERRSRLITGPPGAGKTRLAQEAVRLSGQSSVFVQRPTVLHELLVALAGRLNCRIKRFPELDRATSIALKPAILDSLRHAPRCVVIQDLSNADPRMYRFLQELYYLPDACLIVTGLSRDSLGFVRKLLWDPREEIPLGPLSRPEARRLFELAADAFELRSLDLDYFRRKVLESAHGNPGQIVAMCRFAGRAEYRAGRHIMFLPLRMDVLSSGFR
jgi:hypothetical protein